MFLFCICEKCLESIQRAAVACRRATSLATHLPNQLLICQQYINTHAFDNGTKIVKKAVVVFAFDHLGLV
jgi:hypothetical protein